MSNNKRPVIGLPKQTEGHAATTEIATTPAPTAQYCIVSEVDIRRFTARVEALMIDGWALQGGVQLAEFHQPERGQRVPGYHQAMVKV